MTKTDLADAGEFLEKDSYEVYGAIEKVKEEIHKLRKKAMETNHPNGNFGFGGTIYTEAAEKRLDIVKNDIYKFIKYQRESYKKGEKYKSHLLQKAKNRLKA